MAASSNGRMLELDMMRHRKSIGVPERHYIESLTSCQVFFKEMFCLCGSEGLTEIEGSMECDTGIQEKPCFFGYC